MIHNTQSAQISQKLDERNIHVIMKTMCTPGFTTMALWPLMHLGSWYMAIHCIYLVLQCYYKCQTLRQIEVLFLISKYQHYVHWWLYTYDMHNEIKLTKSISTFCHCGNHICFIYDQLWPTFLYGITSRVNHWQPLRQLMTLCNFFKLTWA